MRLEVLALFLTAAATAAAQQAPAATAPNADKPQQAEKATGSIEGKLIDAATGEPINKATLYLFQLPGAAGLAMSGQPQSTTATSDAEGKFSFTTLEAGRYMLSAEKLGYSRQQYGSRAGQMGSGTNLNLSAGQKITSLEFKLTRQAVITGRVLDEDGEPVPQAMVMVLQNMPFASQPRGMQGNSTNDLGEFRIANLGPGKYLVRADARGSFVAQTPAPGAAKEGTLRYVATFYPSGADPGSASVVTLAAGQQAQGIDIRLRKARTFQVSGKVLGVPADVSRVQVNLQPDVTASGGFFSGGGGGGGMVKPDGTFLAPSVPPGSYDAIVMSYEAGMPAVLGRTPVTVTTENVDNVTIQAGAPLELNGRVVVEGESSEKPAGQVSVMPVKGMVPFYVQPARIQDDGTFKLRGVPRAKMMVNVFGLPANMYVKSVRVGDADATETGMDLTAAETATEVQVRVSDKGASLDGVVLDPANKPMPGVLVTLLPHPFGPERPATNLLRKTANTDQNGRYSIKGIAPGEYRAYAWDTPMISFTTMDAEKLKPYDKHAATVNAKEGGQQQLELRVVALNVE